MFCDVYSKMHVYYIKETNRQFYYKSMCLSGEYKLGEGRYMQTEVH